MSLKKYYGAVRFTEALVKAHKEGNPFKPECCFGGPSVYFVKEEAQSVKPKPCVFGSFIQCQGAVDLCASVNAVLNGGGEVYAHRAFPFGQLIKCQIKLGEGGVIYDDETADEEELVLAEDKIPEPVTLEVMGEEPVEGEEVVVIDTEEALDPTATEEDESEGPDFEHAAKIVRKKDLAAYADKFGIKLDAKNANKKEMLAAFKGMYDAKDKTLPTEHDESE